MNRIRSIGKMMIPQSCLWLFVFAAFSIPSANAQIPQTKLENPHSGYPEQGIGNSVAIDGDTMIVGAPNTETSGRRYSGLAQVYVSDGKGGWTLQAELSPSDATENQRFGSSVSISGNRAIVGAYEDNSGKGSAYVFIRSGAIWTQQAKLTAFGDAAGNDFGYSVAISGETAVVAEFGKYEEVKAYPGSAYIFAWNGSIWTQAHVITPENADENLHFPVAVSVSEKTVAIASGASNGSGVVYVYAYSNGAWTQQAKLIDSNPLDKSFFGRSASISGATLLVGAPWDGEDPVKPGSVYVFKRDGAAWKQKAKIVGSDVMDSQFGSSVSLSGDKAVIGEVFNYLSADKMGAAFIYARNDSKWIQKAKLTASDAKSRDGFGESVGISGDKVVVGASGSIYAFKQNDSRWTQRAKISARTDAAANDFFGGAVAISGNAAVVGAPHDRSKGYYSGTAWVFAYQNGIWQKQANLLPSDGEANDLFGCSVAISGDTTLIGADDAFKDGDSANGAVYVFTRNDSKWIQQAKLTSSDAGQGNHFGASVSLFGDTAVVGTYLNGAYIGSAYVFDRSGEIWTQKSKLTPPDAAINTDFGACASISGDTMIIGERYRSNHTGAAYIYTKQNSSWALQATLHPSDPRENMGFGWSVAISGDTAIIGACGGDFDRGAGVVYIFARSGSVWSEQQRIVGPLFLGEPLNSFGWDVAVSGNQIVIGNAHDDPSGRYTGAAYVYQKSGSIWTETAKLISSDATRNDFQGLSVAVNAGRVIVGAPSKDDPENASGAVYIYYLAPPTKASPAWELYR